jgi:hypothetical protein
VVFRVVSLGIKKSSQFDQDTIKTQTFGEINAKNIRKLMYVDVGRSY